MRVQSGSGPFFDILMEIASGRMRCPMAYEVLLLLCVFFLGSACGALLVSLQRCAHRAKVVNEFRGELRRGESRQRPIHQWLLEIRVLEIDPMAADDRIDRWR